MDYNRAVEAERGREIAVRSPATASVQARLADLLGGTWNLGLRGNVARGCVCIE